MNVASYLSMSLCVSIFSFFYDLLGEYDEIFLKRKMEEAGLPATFMEEGGYKHEWRFWDKYIEKSLEFFGMVGETGGKEFLG